MSKKSFLNALSNKALDEKLNQLVSGEREILTEIIIHIREVASRKMYLDFGYSSLFDYLTQRMGYANASAQRRIDAARLSMDVPAVIDHIESGDLNLSQISVMAQAMRQVPCDRDTKEQLVSDLCEKTVSQSEVLISKALNIPIKEITKTKHQKDESIRLEITFTKEQWQKLTRARDLLSSSLPDGTWDQVFEYMSEQVIQRKDKTILKQSKSEKVAQSEYSVQAGSSNKFPDQTLEPGETYNRKPRTHIPIPIQRKVLNRDRCCQYQSKIANQKCSSTWKLAIDHIQPLWAGGSSDPENLRVLCAAHNSKVYQEQAGIRRA